MISVVVATKNREDVIKETIQSIVDQTSTDWELLIIDDSSDNPNKTRKIINSFKNDKIKFMPLPIDHGFGLASARNYGNMMAQGKYIAVLDSDDIALPDRLSITVSTFKKNSCDVVYGEVLKWFPKTHTLEKRSQIYESRTFDYNYYKKHNFIPHSASAYTREIAVEFPYNSFFRRACDYDFFSRLGKYNKKFTFVNKIFSYQRIHSKSITSQIPNHNLNDFIAFNRNWLKNHPRKVIL